MLKTALKPKWILALLGALLLASGFVLLSQWQFSRSQDAPPPPVSTTESSVPLTDHFEPETVMFESVADQVVTAKGRFLKDKEVLVRGRVQDGTQGFWVVSAFAVDGAPDQNTIPVVRGWQPESTTPPAAPAGELEVTGRLLPTEAPIDQKPDGDPALRSLSVAELINIWDVPSYSGFIVASQVTGPDGADAGATSVGLDEVTVGPQPQEQPLNWLNIFYGIEWVVFAGFAVFLWWRLVVDDYRRQQEDIEDALAEAQAATNPPTHEDQQ
ncbi:SURF1 family protein [Arthrobacter rhombi]|uniref:SURF1 family protein n=1 Tax=Arthrobacter rhombi TaxID=71253 RepID=UPI003FD4E4C6